MSMKFSVYVGPVLVCSPGNRIEMSDELADRLDELRGEEGAGDSAVYLGPNVDVPGITRQLRFDEYSDAPVITDILAAVEMRAFKDCFVAEIAQLKREFRSVEVGWGIVCSFR